MKGPIGIITTAAGAPVEVQDTKTLNKNLLINEYFLDTLTHLDRERIPERIAFNSCSVEVQDTKTLNKNLLINEYFLDTLTHLDRERIPERIVHAKAGGAFGYFEVTHDIKHICKAKLFSHVGKKTPIAARFSPVVVERGGIDTSRDARGFAVKFYTEEGNFDIVGFNTPVFAIKDPVWFPTFVRGFAIHTYEVANEIGEKFYIRFHFLPDAGIKNLRSDDAQTITSADPDYAMRDLYNAIGKGEFPSWTVKIQILNLEDVKNAGFDVFDVTKVLPLEKYPLHPLGKMVLNKNPINYFAEIEQIAFSPANLVPGILGGPDKVFEARRFAYRDAQYYRLGANFYNIPVNCPLLTVSRPYNRDGRPPVLDNGRDTPNYYPNSYNGAMPYKDEKRPELSEIIHDEANNIAQAAEFYMNEITKDERRRLVENVLFSLGPVNQEVQERAVKLFYLVHPDLGMRVEKGLLSNRTRIRITSRLEKDHEEDCEDCDDEY
ncbi:catalase domain-containing protein [Phthorimaea operculella]|nr:catalase domain-containing protein [Phthorimaea operculella]